MPSSLVIALGAALASSAAVEAGLVVAGGIGAALVGAAAAVGLGSVFARMSKTDLANDSKSSLSTGRDPVAPWQWIYGETRVGGTITFLAAGESPFGEINGVLHMVITLAGHEVQSIGDIYFNDEKVTLDGQGFVTSGQWAGQWVNVTKALGNESVQPFPLLLASNVGWTDAHRQNGKAKIYLWMRWNQNVFARGVPKITAVVKGRKVYDPRSGLTAWSDNWALCVSDWLTNDQVGLGVDYAAEMDEAQLIAAANTCDEAVALAAGGTEKRYTMNGAMQVGGSARDTLGRLNTAANGIVRFIGGKWKIYPAVYSSPSITLTNDDLRGALHIMPRVSKRDLCNRVKGLYSGPDNLWQPTDFPPVKNATYLAEDQGEELWRELDLQFTNSTSMAQRIAKIELERVRQQILVEWPGKLGCYRLQPGDTVMVTLTRYGWSSKVFEVVSTKLAFEQADDGMTVGCDLVLRETASAVYAWNSGEETAGDPAPDTDLPDAFTVHDPINVAASSGTSDLLIAGDGTVISRIRLRWDAAVDAFVTSGGHVVVQYKKQADSAWVDGPVALGNSTQVFLHPVDDGAIYDIRVAFENQIRVRSNLIQISHTVVGKTELPSDVTVFTLEGTVLTWSTVADVDVFGYLLRYQPGTSRSWGDAIPLHNGELTSSPYDMLVKPTGPVTLMVKAVDSSGNESQNAAYIVTDFGDAVVANVVETFDRKAAGFPGTKTSCSVSGGNLVSDTITPLAWKPNDEADAWSTDSSTLAWAVLQYAAMTYVDTLTITQALAGSLLTIQYDIQGDPWSLAYRENSAARAWSGDATTLAWHADSSTLAWTLPDYLPWPGQITVRNSIYDFRIMAGQANAQGIVSQLTMTVDAPDIDETLDNVVISAGGTRLPITKTYSVIKNIQLTVQADGGTAISARTDDKVTTIGAGPLVHGLDAAGANTSALIDARVQGY